jgi:penicillin-binding protein 2
MSVEDHRAADDRRDGSPVRAASDPVPPRDPARFVIFALAFVLAASGLTFRLATLQVVGSSPTQAALPTPYLDTQPVPAPRGLIYDRNGRPLVTNVPSYAVKIRPADLPISLRSQVIDRLAAILGMDPTTITTTIDASPGNRFDLVRIASDVPEATARLISEEGYALPGVQVDVESRREYLNGPLFSQIVGYTGPISAEELQALAGKDYRPDDLLGKTGVEAVYESVLRGTVGLEAVQRDAAGRPIGVAGMVRQPVPGDSLLLTIDTKEQELAQKALTWGLQTAGLRRGVFIVMNPQTGEILALVSLPTYDNNLFAQGISAAAFQKLLSDPDKPLVNHAISDTYPPGSTFKLVTATGALADGKLSPGEKLVTRPYLLLGTTRFWDWNHRGFGLCDLMCGYGNSSDTYFYQVAGRLGIDRLAYWAHQFGFAAPTGIDLPAEAAGIIPSTQWKLQSMGEPIYPGEVYQAGIGQGYDAVTPLQLANAYAALANGGKLLVPHVVRAILGPDGTPVETIQPELIRRLPVPPDVLRTMRVAARNVVVIRHTLNLVDMPLVVAGKTGVAEFGIRDKNGVLPYHTWFVAFVPRNPYPTADDPQGFKAVARTDSPLLVLAFIYDARTVGNAAVEVVKDYLQMRFHISGDYRIPSLLQRGNFYQGPD